MRSELILIAALMWATPASAQVAPGDPPAGPMQAEPATPPPPAPDPAAPTPEDPAAPVPASPAAPTPTPTAPTPASPPAPPLVAPSPSSSDGAPKRVVHVAARDAGFVLGFEAGVAMPGGTTATVYGTGFGSGLIAGFRYDRLTFEVHLHQRYSLQASDDQLRGETTVGSLSTRSALARVRLFDAPMLEVMAGPAMVTTPIYVIGEDGVGDQRVEGMALDGVGAMIGASIGIKLGRQIVVSCELRTLVAMRWELPGHTWVVPGDPAPDGGRMFTPSRDDATGSANTATLVIRAFL